MRLAPRTTWNLGKILGVLLHGGTRRSTDHAIAVPRGDDNRAGAGVGLQIVTLVIRIAVIDIRPVAKHRDPQPREIIQNPRDRVSGERLDADHAPTTCRVQSARL